LIINHPTIYDEIKIIIIREPPVITFGLLFEKEMLYEVNANRLKNINNNVSASNQ